MTSSRQFAAGAVASNLFRLREMTKEVGGWSFAAVTSRIGLPLFRRALTGSLVLCPSGLNS